MSAENFVVEDSGEEDSFQVNHKSYRTQGDGESILIEETDSDSETVNSSMEKSGVRSSSVGASEEEESVVRQMKKRQSIRMSLHPRQAENESSDEDEMDAEHEKTNDGSANTFATEEEDDVEEEEEEVERRAYSPVTRMSIHGVASGVGTSEDDSSSDEDEPSKGGDDTEEESIAFVPKQRKNIIISDDEEEEGEERKRSRNDLSFNSQSTPRPMPKRRNLSTSLSLEEEQESINTKLSSTSKSDERERSTDQPNDPEASRGRHSINMRASIAEKPSSPEQPNDPEMSRGELSFNGGRHSISMRASIGEKLSSTHIGEEHGNPVIILEEPPVGENDAKNGTKKDQSSSVELIEKSQEILCVSSGDEEVTFVEETRPSLERPDVKPGRQTLVQPTITSYVRGQQQQQRVSQSEYDAKIRRMAELKSQVVLIDNMMRNSGKLPDKGASLVRRLAEIKGQIFELSKVIEMTQATPSKSIKKTIKRDFDNEKAPDTGFGGQYQPGQPVISWDTIKKATDDIQPRHTGKQGIATFENQKLLTMDRLETLHKSIETCPSEDTLADPPKLLKIELMNHQRHALAWMLWRETQKPRGGILADDMGLGKTLSMISLVLKSAELDPDGELLNRESDSDGDEENQNPNGGWKAKGRKDYYAGGTLIVCPASLMRQWEGEITNRVKRNSLAVCVHHGTQREAKPRHLAKYDVVITTYNIVSRESKATARGGEGVYGVNWERIILDEAHVIRNHKSVMSEACCGLKGHYRWLLTGTPIQNKEMDVYALMKFLRCTPFNDLVHWKRWIDNKTAGGAMRLNTIMKSIMLRRTKKQLQERGALTSLPSKTIELIEVKLEKDEMNVYQKVLMYSKNLFAQFLQQRAEKEHAINLGFGGRNRGAANHAFDKVHQKLKSMHSGENDGGEVKQHQILVLLLRLRQICCHPGLINAMLSDDDEGNLELSGTDEGEVDLLGALNKLKLGDVIAEHEAKVAKAVDAGQEDDVSLNLTGEFDRPEAMAKAASKLMLKSNPIFRYENASSKIERAMQLMEEKIFHTDDKAIVVSQWTSMLDILGSHLSERNVPFVSLTGKVPVKFRNDIVVDFNKPQGRSKVSW